MMSPTSPIHDASEDDNAIPLVSSRSNRSQQLWARWQRSFGRRHGDCKESPFYPKPRRLTSITNASKMVGRVFLLHTGACYTLSLNSHALSFLRKAFTSVAIQTVHKHFACDICVNNESCDVVLGGSRYVIRRKEEGILPVNNQTLGLGQLKWKWF